MFCDLTITDWFVIGFAVIGVFAEVARWTPNTVDDKWAQRLWNIINILGRNTRRARNDPNI